MTGSGRAESLTSTREVGMTRTRKARIVVLGGGFAGLESAFLLRARLGDRADITLVSDKHEFLFKPNTIYIPFGTDPASLLIPLSRPAHRRDIELVRGSAQSIDPDARLVHLGGRHLAYDFLVVATGAAMRPEEVPGLVEHAETIWTPRQMSSFGRSLRGAVERARQGGAEQTILFSVPPGNKCAGPLYELVLMTETWLRRRRVRDRFHLVFATYEESYIQAFGPKLHDVVTKEFDERGVEGHLGSRLGAVMSAEAAFDNAPPLAYDLLVAFPPYVAAVDFGPELPTDQRGFILTEPASRRVPGHERIYAPGDAGDFPVKQAFLAFLQADAAAEDIAAGILDREPRSVFDPVSMCVMEELDTATFAQVPLTVTGDPNRPVAVRADADGAYRVGVSPAWRLGKKLLGLYLPFRFNAGLPFHAGVPWRAMDAGLKGMSALLARR
jgi:NADH dehydrogenase FAD-containing subunit